MTRLIPSASRHVQHQKSQHRQTRVDFNAFCPIGRTSSRGRRHPRPKPPKRQSPLPKISAWVLLGVGSGIRLYAAETDALSGPQCSGVSACRRGALPDGLHTRISPTSVPPTALNSRVTRPRWQLMLFLSHTSLAALKRPNKNVPSLPTLCGYFARTQKH